MTNFFCAVAISIISKNTAGEENISIFSHAVVREQINSAVNFFSCYFFKFNSTFQWKATMFSKNRTKTFRKTFVLEINLWKDKLVKLY